MKNILRTAMLIACLLMQLSAGAQCAITNTAVRNNEFLAYNLYFNWQFVWVKAGTASMSTVETTYKGQKAFRASLITRSSSQVDKMFMMRDTLLVYASKDMVPLYYRKGAREGDRYYADEMWYTYPQGKCNVSLRHLTSHAEVWTEKHTYNECVYDMLNIFLRARNYDPKDWKKGHTIPVSIAGGDELIKAKLVFQGKSTVKADNGKKYKCLELSYIERDNGKDKEIVRFYVTDDTRHIPIRLDMYLRFGTAKAFLSSMKI